MIMCLHDTEFLNYLSSPYVLGYACYITVRAAHSRPTYVPALSATTVDRKNSEWHRSMVLTRAKQSLLKNELQEGEFWRMNTTRVGMGGFVHILFIISSLKPVNLGVDFLNRIQLYNGHASMNL